jgi:hypothetical protein
MAINCDTLITIHPAACDLLPRTACCQLATHAQKAVIGASDIGVGSRAGGRRRRWVLRRLVQDRDWEIRTHQHYGVPPYWGA